jgi:hypothetical protein
VDGGQEVARGLLVAGGNRTELLDLGEEVLDQVALAIKLSVIVAQRGPVGPRWDHGGFASRSQRLEDTCVGVERFVGDQHIRLHRRQEVICSHEVVRFPAGQEKAERIAERIYQCMDLGTQSAAGAPDRLVLPAARIYLRTTGLNFARWRAPAAPIRSRMPPCSGQSRASPSGGRERRGQP